MRKCYIITALILLGLLSSHSAIASDNDNIKPFARNLGRIIQDFSEAHAKKHQRPEKFCLVNVSNDMNVLWASTFDESYGCLFACARGPMEKLLDVGYNASGEHVDLAFRNGVMIVTKSDKDGNITGAQFFTFKDHAMEPLPFTMKLVDGQEVYVDENGKSLKLNKVQKMLDKGLKKKEQPVVYNSENLEWIPFRKIGNYIEADEDITLSQRPVLARANYKTNEFTTQAKSMLDAANYRHIIFKNQVGDATVKSVGNDATVYSLNDAKAIKTMFRGYKENELYPIIATDEYLATHEMKFFKRWKYPEKVVPMERDKQQMVSNYYGGRKIKNSRWLADLEESDRKLYAVEFMAEGNKALAVIACFIGNQLVSTFDMFALVEPGRNWLWTPGDKGDFMKALPELQGLALTDEGFELYVSQMVGNDRHMIVLREERSMFIELIDQEF